MRVINTLLIVSLSVVMIGGAAAFSVPDLYSMPILNSLKPNTALETPQVSADVPAETADGPFTLSLSGNVYLDKIPVNGAEVSVYLNGRYMARTTAGDLYMFKVPGVQIGDTIRVDATYQGYTGSETAIVKFKNMYQDVYVKTDRSFIRTALEMLPNSEDMQDSQQTSTQQSEQPASTGSSGNTETSTSNADAGQLTKQIWGDTSSVLGNTLNQFKSGL